MPTLGAWDIAIILLLVVIVVGAGRVPALGGVRGREIPEREPAKREAEAGPPPEGWQDGTGGFAATDAIPALPEATEAGADDD